MRYGNSVKAALQIGAFFTACAMLSGHALAITKPVTVQDERTISRIAAACMQKPEGQTTAGMFFCHAQAYRAYRQLERQTYARVARAAGMKRRHALALTEDAWLAYAKRQDRALATASVEDRGTMMYSDIELARIYLARERIRELEASTL